MSIRHGLPALLEDGPRYGGRLRTEFEARPAGPWPLNAGQVHTARHVLDFARTRGDPTGARLLRLSTETHAP